MAPLSSMLFSCRTGAHTSAVPTASWVVTGVAKCMRCMQYEYASPMANQFSFFCLFSFKID